MKAKKCIYSEVSNKIIAAMEKGNIPWLKPWAAHGSKACNILMPHNALTGKQYNGINLMLLWSENGDYPTQQYVTYKQAQELGGNVRRGESGCMIVYWNFYDKKNEKTGEMEQIPFLKSFTVFNVAQCENLNSDKFAAIQTGEQVNLSGALALAHANGAKVLHGGNTAAFAPSKDVIMMPNVDQFKNENAYNAVLAHELTHWTGHKSRLDRDMSGRFGNAAYAFEELIAEMGAAFVCANLGYELNTLQHASYLQSWIKVLKEDNKAIFTACTKAKLACEFLLSHASEQKAAA
jgi:antirestriction protein ArdC